MAAGDQLLKQRERVLREPVANVLWSLSWPYSLGLISIVAFNIVDTLYIGWLGSDELTAMGFCFPIIFSLSAIAIGMSTGATSVISRRIGASDWQKVRILTFNAFLFVLLTASLLAVLMSFTSRPIFRYIGASEELIPIIHQYMDVWYLGLPLLMLPIVMTGLLRSSGNANTPAILMVVAAIINAIASPILVFGLLGAPELGMAGAAWGTLLARAIIGSIGAWHLFHRQLMEISIRALKQFLPSVKEILHYAVPAFMAQLGSPLSAGIITYLLAGQNESAVAAFAIGIRIEALVMVPFFALQAGVGPFVGQNIGAGIIKRLREAERSVLVFAFGWGAASGLLLAVFGRPIADAFTNDPEIIDLAVYFLRLLALGLWGGGLLFVGIGIFNPLGYPNLGMGLSALRYLVLYAGSAILLTHLLPAGMKLHGVFVASPISFAIAGLISLYFIRRLLDRPARTMDRNEEVQKPLVALDDPVPYQHPPADPAEEPGNREAS